MTILSLIVRWIAGWFATREPAPPPAPQPKPAVKPAPAPSDPVSAFTDQEVIARTLWGEARGQGETGMHAVCNVIVNRAANPGWWGHDLRSVCLAREQFSCWNASDPQAYRMRHPLSDAAIDSARQLAARAIAGILADLTDGADHYFAETIPQPAWARGKSATFVCGTSPYRQFFYRIGLGG